MNPRAAWTRAGLVLAAILVVDQVVKQVIVSSLQRGEEVDVVLGIKLVNVRNSGVAFGVLEDGGTLVAIFIALAVVALLVYFARHATRPLYWLPTGLLLGGALGNIADRVREGSVIDFVKLPYWPAFNVADSAITVGVVALLFVLERGDEARSPA